MNQALVGLYSLAGWRFEGWNDIVLVDERHNLSGELRQKPRVIYPIKW